MDTPPPAHTEGRAPARRKGLLLLLLAALVAAYFLFGGHRLLTVESLQSNRDQLVALTEQRPASSRIAAVMIYTGVVALSIPVAALLSMTAGLLFGLVQGLLVVLVGATAGAVLVFLAARYLLQDVVRRRAGSRVGGITARFEEEGFTYLLVLRLLPILPFWLVNLAPALTRMPARTFALATAIGIIPASFVYVNLGHTLGRVEAPSDLVGGEMFLALSLIALLALVPLAWRWFTRGRREEAEER
jgi:uncharacterized membrane protein YdjX (TVP38/TMEM64 family)